MTAWFVNHVLPGLITAAIIGASHAHLWRRMKKLADQQTAELKSGSEKEGGA